MERRCFLQSLAGALAALGLSQAQVAEALPETVWPADVPPPSDIPPSQYGFWLDSVYCGDALNIECENEVRYVFKPGSPYEECEPTGRRFVHIRTLYDSDRPIDIDHLLGQQVAVKILIPRWQGRQHVADHRIDAVARLRRVTTRANRDSLTTIDIHLQVAPPGQVTLTEVPRG